MNNENSLDQTLFHHQGRLKGWIRRQLDSADDAADVYQDTVTAVWQQSRRQPLTHPFAYAVSVARHLIARHHQHMARQGGTVDEVPDIPVSGPERVLEQEQRVMQLQQALAQLSPLRRDILLRRRLHGQSREAIAAELGLSVEAVKKHITRAMLQLNDALPETD